MSMVHESFFLDWNHYSRDLLNNDWPDPDKLSGWRDLLIDFKRELRNVAASKMPAWKADLLEDLLNEIKEEIDPAKPIKSMEAVRNMNYVAILSCTTEKAIDYDYYWDTLKEGLKPFIGAPLSDELVLGSYWLGKAWEFSPSLVTYQFGIILPEKVAGHRKLIKGVNQTAFALRLTEIDWSDNYPIYSPKLPDKDIAKTLQSFTDLQQNLKQAEERKCGILYLLN